jgi:hypothetical protein
MFAGRMFAGKVPVRPSGGGCERRLCRVDAERSVRAVLWTRNAPTWVRRYLATIEPALRYPDAGVPKRRDS